MVTLMHGLKSKAVRQRPRVRKHVNKQVTWEVQQHQLNSDSAKLNNKHVDYK